MHPSSLGLHQKEQKPVTALLTRN